MIEVENLTRDYANFQALKGITFKVEPGETVGFLGPNGAGKTTTLRILTGFLPATRGRAAVAGFDVFAQSLQARAQIGYLPENVPLYPELRVREYLRFRAALKQMPRRRIAARIDEVAAQCGLREVIRKPIAALSRGYRQRVGLADALLAAPPVLILDEPTTGLDPNQRIEIRNLIQSLAPKQTVLFSSHILPEVESVCRRVLLIHRGQIVADGAPADLARKLGGENLYRVALRGVSLPEIARDALSNLPSVARVLSVKETEPGTLGVQLEGKRGADPRLEIYRLAVERQWGLLELAQSTVSLEEIFTRMTLGGGEVAN